MISVNRMIYGTTSRTTPVRYLLTGLLVAAASLMCACDSSSNTPPAPPPPPPPVAITLNGVVSDGPVAGGTIFVFTAEDVQAALDGVDPGGDRAAALEAAGPVATLQRDATDGDQYEISVPGENAGAAVFLVFDNADAEDATYSDTPPNLESVAVLGSAGDQQRVNVSLQTTLIAWQVRAALDPDGDGTVIDAAAVETEIAAATDNILSAFAEDPLGRDLAPSDFDPLTSEDDDAVHAASDAIGLLVRGAAAMLDANFDVVVAALAADSADGEIDGSIPAALNPDAELESLAMATADVAAAGGDQDIAMFANGPCTSAAVALRQACAVDAVDDVLGATAICTDMADDEDRADCLVDAAAEREEKNEECGDIFDARLALCQDFDDMPHEPMFGPSFAANFVDPLAIGDTVAPNPWFSLETGNRWVYAGDGESIEVEVTGETKLIDGVTCVVIVDTAMEDGAVVEITRDWYAQDVSGNVWYCGEIARNFELFDGDEPQEPELVDIDGSWKAGREGAEPGILLPSNPEVGEIIRQEVFFGEAEDVIEVLSVTATETSPGGSCAGDCLMTADTTPLEPDVEENKFYAPGIGLIVEIDVETGDRVELVEFTPAL